MSGGASDYKYFELERLSEDIIIHHSNSVNHRYIGKLLIQLAKVAKDIEWADSGDISDKDAEVSIQAFMSSMPDIKETVAREFMEEIKASIAKLETLLSHKD